MNTYKHKLHLLIFLTLSFILVNTVSDYLFFRLVNINIGEFHLNLTPSVAAFTWPLTYIISDLVIIFYNRLFSIIVVIVGTFSDVMFGFIFNSLSEVHITNPILPTHTLAILGNPIWTLVYTGLLTTIVTSTIELFLFSIIYNIINRFSISAFISIFLTVFLRTFTGDYYTIRNTPNVFKILMDNLSINIAILLIYLISIYILVKIFEFSFSKLRPN